MDLNTLNKIQGLKAADRTPEEKQAIDTLMGRPTVPDTLSVIQSRNKVPSDTIAPSLTTDSSRVINNVLKYKEDLDNAYENALEETRKLHGVGDTLHDIRPNEYIDKIANNVSSYYKKFKNTDKLPISDQQYRELAAQYDARKETYGEDNANIWLNNQFKDTVANNQSWWEQATNAFSHLMPAIEGSIVQTAGMLWGTLNHIAGTRYNDDTNLNWFDSFINDVIDNPVTRYGRDLELAGASNVVQSLEALLGMDVETADDRIEAMKATATKYNPEGIGADAIVTTEEQDKSWFSSATPWQALQSGGFTAAAMLTGAAEAKMAGWTFNALKGGVTKLNKLGWAFKSEKALEGALKGLTKAQNFTDIAVLPGVVGSTEGALEGLNTKIETEREGVEKLNEFYQNKVEEDLKAIGYSDMSQVPEEVYKQAWDKYQDAYIDSRQQIDWASSKAGIHNFWVNSAINGLINSTLKAGIMAPRVQETLRNNRLTGWAVGKPKFIEDADGLIKPKMSKVGSVLQVLKEPAGEGLEEYEQSLSSDVFSAAAENNINEFIKARFDPDSTVNVADSFGSDWAAAWTAFTNSVKSKEAMQSAILGALSSTMGTVGAVGRGYHEDAETGKIVRNDWWDPKNFLRSLDENGNKESKLEWIARVMPWRSGALNSYFDMRKERAEAKETAATLNEWLKDPANRAKWDGTVGTANFMTQMSNAAESNDQFSYRKAQMGKAINDVFMLSKLKGTSYYDSIITDLQRAANMDVSSQEAQNLAQKMRSAGGEEYQNATDEEILEKVQSNANKMLGLMSTVEKESRGFESLLGRIDEDTKQSLVYGKIMEKDFSERKQKLEEEIDEIKSKIRSSRNKSNVNLEDDLKSLIAEHGSLNKAIKAQEENESRKKELEKKVEELEAIDSEKLSEKQQKELERSKKELKSVKRKAEKFKALYDKDGNVDSSLATLVLNEQEIMDLDLKTRAIMLAQGAARLYNATHQNRQKIDQLNLEIDELDHQMDELRAKRAQWVTADGKVKKHHNKQVKNADKNLSELEKKRASKMRELNTEQGKTGTKHIYSQAQQEVIDNLVQQGMSEDKDFLDKVVDIARCDAGIKDYHTQLQAILSDPRVFQKYVKKAKLKAQTNIIKRRAERIADLQNFEEFSQELDRINANASTYETQIIYETLREKDAQQKKKYLKEHENPEEGELQVIQDKDGNLNVIKDGRMVPLPLSNFDRYRQNARKQQALAEQFVKNPNLTDNDMSLLVDAMQYLASKGIEVDDREAAVEALIERDELGNQGGKFRQWVEKKNEERFPQQRTTMPYFTSIAQVVGQYVELLNGKLEDDINKGNMNPVVAPAEDAPVESAPTADEAQTTPQGNPSPTQDPGAASLFAMGEASKQHQDAFVEDGTVKTDAQTQAVQERQEQKKAEEAPKSQLEETFEQILPKGVAEMLNAFETIVEGSDASDEAKAKARQYLNDIAVEANGKSFSTTEEFLEALQEKIETLREQNKAIKRTIDSNEESNLEFSKEELEESAKVSGGAAGLLSNLYGNISVRHMRGGRGRRRTLTPQPQRPENPNASWIHSANIAYIESQNPDAWAVTFTDDHDIDNWNRKNYPALFNNDTPIYFITDSEWEAKVKEQMDNYKPLDSMPVVAAVKVDAPENPQKTTAIEVDGQWYQPVCILPGGKSTRSGASFTNEIRRKASQSPGRHLITENGMPNGAPLTTRVYGKNYITGHAPDTDSQTRRENTREANTDVIDNILTLCSTEDAIRLKSLPREEMLMDPAYQAAKKEFLDGMSWNHDDSNSAMDQKLVFTPTRMRDEGKARPILVFTKPMSEAVANSSRKPLLEVLQNGSNDEVVTFNSRTERAYKEVIRPLFAFLQGTDHYDKTPKIITKADLEADPDAYQKEADRLTKALNGYDKSDDSTKGIKGIKDFIYINPKSGWYIKVTAPSSSQKAEDIDNSETVFKVFLANTNQEIDWVELGAIKAGANDMEAAKDLLRNLMYDSQTGQVRDFLYWRVPASDAVNLNNNEDPERRRKARRNYSDIIDDGILEMASDSAKYEQTGFKLRTPVNKQGRPLYRSETTANADNAQGPMPETPQAQGAIITPDGSQVMPDNGVVLEDNNPQQLSVQPQPAQQPQPRTQTPPPTIAAPATGQRAENEVGINSRELLNVTAEDYGKAFPSLNARARQHFANNPDRMRTNMTRSASLTAEYLNRKRTAEQYLLSMGHSKEELQKLSLEQRIDLANETAARFDKYLEKPEQKPANETPEDVEKKTNLTKDFLDGKLTGDQYLRALGVESQAAGMTAGERTDFINSFVERYKPVHAPGSKLLSPQEAYDKAYKKAKERGYSEEEAKNFAQTAFDNASKQRPKGQPLQPSQTSQTPQTVQTPATPVTPTGPVNKPNPPAPKNNNLPKSPSLQEAERIKDKIIADSKQFILSEDEKYYYIEDKATGQRTKYLRVTTVIGADRSLPELTEEDAKRRRIREYVWTPTQEEIYAKLKEKYNLPEISKAQLRSLNTTDKMSNALNIPTADIKKAVAELRTKHKEEKYGVWGTPSTSIGNTADNITRDFFNGELKESYPNITKEALQKFVQQLTIFKNSLAPDITIVSEGIMAHGEISMYDASGNERRVKVAGTLDLFGYDKDGNFYIFDMKTTRNHSAQKLQDEKAKWSRQISMYADLLKQTYGIEVPIENLRIIPINVDYPTPRGPQDEYLDPMGPVYSETKDGQLQMENRRGEKTDFNDSNPQMRFTNREQFKLGYTTLSINFDNLSSEDQDIADSLLTQANDEPGSNNAAPVEATIETKSKPRPAFLNPLGSLSRGKQGHQNPPAKAPRVVQNGVQAVLPLWDELSIKVKMHLKNSKWRVTKEEEYNKILDDPADEEALKEYLICRHLM